MSAIRQTSAKSQAYLSFLSLDILEHPGMFSVVGYPRTSAICQITAKSKAYLSFLSLNILGHPGMSDIYHTLAESQAYFTMHVLFNIQLTQLIRM